MERYVIFNPDTGEVLSLPNVKPTEGSFIKVEPTSVEGILKGLEQLSHYCVEYSKRKKQYELKLVFVGDHTQLKCFNSLNIKNLKNCLLLLKTKASCSFQHHLI